MSNIEEYTKNFKFIIPEFNVATWHTEIKENFKAIDALIANFVQSQQYKGAWKQVTQYEIGDLVYISDEDSNNYGGLFKVLVDHITTADDFDTFLGSNPTYYDLQGEMGAQVAALRAQDWAEKTDGIVIINESLVDYSSKAYAIGGVGTETNNSKYFKEQAELARDGILLDPGFIAIKNDMLGDENIKTVADNILNVNSIGDNILSILSVYNNLSDINVCVSNMSAIVDAPNQATNAQNSATSAAQSAQLAQEAALSVTGFDLFDHKWSDHLLNDQNWLRADTFSWQSGTVYKAAYDHLEDEWVAWWNTHTIADLQYEGNVAYAVMPDGHKICGGSDSAPQEQEGYAVDVYNNTGVAWFYIIDTDNKRFKLPRTKYGFVGLRDAVGKYVPESLPNIKGSITGGLQYPASFSGSLYSQGIQSNKAPNADWGGQGFGLDASLSSSVYQDNAPVQQKATQMYLYFYVGNFTQTATEQTAGLNTELFNEKVDLDFDNMNPSATAKKVINGWGMPDWSSVIGINLPYTAPQNGYILRNCNDSNAYIHIFVNGISSVCSSYGNYNGNLISIAKGDVVTLNASNGSFNIYFIPCKGG